MDPLTELRGIRQTATATLNHIDSVIERLEAEQELPEGTEIDRTDAQGVPLKVGDDVEVSGSERFGTFTGAVAGPAPDLPGRNNPRVRVPHPDDPDYTTSTARINAVSGKVEPALASATFATQANPAGQGNGYAREVDDPVEQVKRAYGEDHGLDGRDLDFRTDDLTDRAVALAALEAVPNYNQYDSNAVVGTVANLWDSALVEAISVGREGSVTLYLTPVKSEEGGLLSVADSTEEAIRQAMRNLRVDEYDVLDGGTIRCWWD